MFALPGNKSKQSELHIVHIALIGQCTVLQGLSQPKVSGYRNFSICTPLRYSYDELSDQGYTSLPKSGEIESGQMVSEKVKLTYFDVYLSQTM